MFSQRKSVKRSQSSIIWASRPSAIRLTEMHHVPVVAGKNIKNAAEKTRNKKSKAHFALLFCINSSISSQASVKTKEKRDRMKRKVFACLVSLAMLVSLSACGTVENSPMESAPQTSATAPAVEPTGGQNQTTLSPQQPQATAPDDTTTTNQP